MTLAFSSYEGLPELLSSLPLLNLAWTTDERSLLDVDIAAILEAELDDEKHEHLAYLNRYFLDDPFGEQVLKHAVARYFGMADHKFGVTCGAGVNSLLHLLAMSCRDKPAYVVGEVYPDLPHWVETIDSRCVYGAKQQSIPEHIVGAGKAGAALVLLEHPSAETGSFSRAEVRELCNGIEANETFVCIDESYANYLAPADSFIPLALETNNLVVLRGFSKAYSMGSLRLGYGVSSASLTERLRKLVPPMLASSLSLRLGRRLLALDDITIRLRSELCSARVETLDLLQEAGIEMNADQATCYPHLFCSGDAQAAQQQLGRFAILGKIQPSWRDGQRTRCRVSIPLQEDRRQQLRARIFKVRT